MSKFSKHRRRLQLMLPLREAVSRPQVPLERLTVGATDWVYSKQGSGPPLLLIHGLSGSTRWWRRNIPAYAPRFTVFAVELTGFASNRRGRPLSMAASAGALAELMDALGLGSADVVSHSMGGHISVHLTALHPEKVKRLVLSAPSGLLRHSLPGMAGRVVWSTRFGAPDFTPTILADALRAGPLNLLLAARALLRDDVEQLLPRIRAETLVLAGGRDVIVPPPLCETYAARIPGARYAVIHGAGHNLMYDRADAYNDAVLSFLLEGRAQLEVGAAPSAHERGSAT